MFQAVIAAGHLEHDQNVVLAGGGRLCRPRDELGHHGAHGQERRALKRSRQKMRRLNMKSSGKRDDRNLRQLIFRQRQNRMNALAHPAARGLRPWRAAPTNADQLRTAFQTRTPPGRQDPAATWTTSSGSTHAFVVHNPGGVESPREEPALQPPLPARSPDVIASKFDVN